MAGNKVIGVPKEVKNHEYRVALTPAGADALVKAGHTVYVQKGAGVGSGIQDSDYEAIGAKILDTAGEVWAAADMIMKVGCGLVVINYKSIYNPFSLSHLVYF
eukprot:comp17005_c0_seq2/m.15681 comp17005_c0_seq2/g.15681  ORF comp17005_c0_seq2/g.15681 comp17005_c0_seq2/m.15681 type:complete len:103 (-) comp17005_c0_seq2:142-450(-)